MPPAPHCVKHPALPAYTAANRFDEVILMFDIFF